MIYADLLDADPAVVADRFWRRVEKSDPDQCWPWVGEISNNYGVMRLYGKRGPRLGAHRVSWILEHGPITDGLHVCHVCDNPPCVNPAHLFLGTPADNSADKWQKGRAFPPPHRQGEDNHQAKLTASQVLTIRDLVAQGHVQRQVASFYGVSPSTVHLIVKGKKWGWL